MKKLWSFTKKLRPIKGIMSKPKMSTRFFTEYNDKLYFTLVNSGGDCTLIYECDPKTQEGTDLYEEGGIIWPAPVLDGKIYFYRDRNYRCFNLDTKSIEFEYEDDELDYISGDTAGDPVIDGDDIYFSVVGAFICADKETARLKWKLDLDIKNGVNFCQFQDAFIASGYNDTICCVSKQGEILWRSKVACKNVGTYEDYVVLLDETKVYLLDGGTGKLLSTYKAEHELYTVTAVEGGIVCDTCKFTIVENKIEPVWQVKIKGRYITGSVHDSQNIYFFDNKNNFYTVDIQSGESSIEKLELTMKEPRSIYIESGKLYVFGTNVELDCFEL